MKIYKILLFSFVISCVSNSEESTPKKMILQTEKDSKKEAITINTDNMTKEEKINFLTGKFDPSNYPNFIKIDNYLHTKSEMFLQKETANSFIKMHEAAKEEGITLLIVSGTRNFYTQKSIWEKKYNDYKKEEFSETEIIKKIMLWSSMPSTSRHHWGTDIDINGFDDYFDGENEKSNKEYQWLRTNAYKFGFCQVYTKKGEKGRTTGYNEEKWHWSYMPLSSDYLKQYKELINYKNISGFSASEFAEELNIIEEFVFGISAK